MIWNDIKTCLPTEDGKYIVFCPSANPNNPFIAMAWWHDGEGWSLLQKYWLDTITHWMPLPKPPR